MYEAGGCEASACGAGAGKQTEMSRNNIWPEIWSGDLSLSLQQVLKAYLSLQQVPIAYIIVVT